ncbi:hypothetical protein J3E72DRAFT_177547 [Bipolaris maydis]|nr:hypothetical protein J3E73DRAFT_367018 [Bipolaris maydis]KAJ5061636.1 hypothetical protein J3E74DRAFT_211729 [Bipolaris maydis]KAJ6203245.1 hypothetical protein J3E72DRAFT_177547 [Bipolaris maydis]KAJ6214602.1 hypothetical protein PSV09DRAFT_2180905 [Bipolaris maydis]KAJ6275773.1 hypothetical protein PSV08DRAFT_346189 [Bipolaris maydis]
MLVASLVLIPIAAAAIAPAVQDLADLRSMINAAANSIGGPDNAVFGFGFSSLVGSNSMDTADLVNNITSTILRGKFQLDTNKTEWLTAVNTVNVSVAINSTSPSNTTTPTLSLNASGITPTVLPTATLTFGNVTSDLTKPYLEYVQSIPNLSNNLTALGRRFHSEMNAPVSDAISSLQLTLTVFQIAMLKANLITSLAVLRTIRASSGLESAQAAWGRPLNLPSGEGDDASAELSETLPSSKALTARGQLKRPQPENGRFYTHQELWNRSETQSAKRVT